MAHKYNINCIFNRASLGVEFQEELSDPLLLKMLQAATRASADKDRVRDSLSIIFLKSFFFSDNNETDFFFPSSR